MKLLKTLTLGLVAAATVGTASAQTVIHICGSTAFRAPNTAAIIDYLSAGGTKTVHAGYTGSSLLGDASAILANGTVGSGGTATVIIETYWTGSLAGVVDIVAGNNTGAYLDPSAIGSTAVTAVNSSVVTTTPYGGGTVIAPAATITSTPDVAFSDSYQLTIAKELATGSFSSGTTSVGSYHSVAALAAATASSVITDSGTSGNASDAGFIGIVPFEWVEGNGAPTAVTNISQQNARALLTNGYVSQANLDGSSTDAANYFYAVGRNEDSGTRIGALSESQFGVTGNPAQYAITAGNAGLYPITPLNTEPGIVFNSVGHSGYATGGNVATALDVPEGSFTFSSGKAPDNSGSSYCIGYLGVTDAATAITGGGHALTYGSIAFSVAAVQAGQYTFWTYEHCYRLASTTGTTQGTIINTIADLVYNTDADIKGDGTHQGTTGGVSAGILDNLSAPVLVFRSLIEGLPLSNY